MLDRLFERRDKTIASMIKLGDCLGRSLRENVVLFSVDGDESKVTFVTENDKLISGNFSVDNDVILEGIEVLPLDDYEDQTKFDKFVQGKVSDFTRSLNENDFGGADEKFSTVLQLWETRLKLSTIKDKLHEKTLKFDESLSIIDTDEFGKFNEIRAQIVEFLSENRDRISQIPEIVNAIKLSNTVSTAFNFPKLTYKELEESKTYTLKDGEYSSIYEMLCRQELVKQELVEAKKAFGSVWASNEKIRALAGLLFEDTEKVEQVLAEALVEVPYLAIVSKKELKTTITNSLNLNESVEISEADIAKYSSQLFELKKPVKKLFIDFLNEKYGINVQNLKDPPSFKSLTNTQVVIFEALARISAKGSVQKQVLSEMASMLKSKAGVECIDLNDSLYHIFEDAGYDEVIQEAITLNPASYGEIAQDFRAITDILDAIKQHAALLAAGENEPQYSSDETMVPDEEGMEGMEGGEEEMPPPELSPEEDEEMDAPAMDPDEVPLETPDEEMENGEEEEVPDETADMDDETPEEQSREELVGNLKELEGLIADLQKDLGIDEQPDEDEEYEEEEEEEEEFE